MRNLFLFSVLMVLSVAGAAQFKGKQKPVSFQKHYNEILPKAPQYKLSGWTFAPGATFMLTPFVYQPRTFNSTEVSEFDARARGLGKPALYAEIGRYRMLRYGSFFKYFDYGLSYTGMRGSERANGQTISLPEEAPLTLLEQTRGDFGFHYAQLYFNLNHVWRLSKYHFIQQSIGANAGYAFLANQGGTSLSPVGFENPGRLLAQVHYKVGYGVKMRGNWLIIPSLETPILNGWPWEFGRSSMGYFASRYRPIIFSLRIFLIRNANTLDCTPVRTREGLKMPTDMDKQQEMNEVK